MIIRFLQSIIFFSFLFCTSFAYSQEEYHSKILGMWISENKKQKVKVFFNEKTKTYYGKIIWVYEDDQAEGRVLLDTKNPNPSLRGRRITGINLLYGFKSEGNGKFRGSIYDPISGKPYKCLITLLPDGKASIRGYIFHPIIGRTEIASKISD